jgi:hypothetical protein
MTTILRIEEIMMKKKVRNANEDREDMLEGMSELETNAFLSRHYGKPLPRVEQVDLLRMIHGEGEYFFTGPRQNWVKPVCVGELLKGNEEFNQYFGSTGTDGAVPLQYDAFMTMNTFNPSFGRRMQAHVTGLHALVIEHDDMDLDKQVGMWGASDMPFTLKTFSGGKSVHVLVRFDEDLSLEEWDDLTVKTVGVFPGADPQILTDYSFLSRTPMAYREDKGRKQTVLDVGVIVPVGKYREWLDRKLVAVDPAKLEELVAARRKTRKVGAAKNARRGARIKATLKELPLPRNEAEGTGKTIEPSIPAGESANETPRTAVVPGAYNLVEKWWTEHEEEARPRTYRLQAVMLHALRHRYSPATVLAAVRALPVAAKWQQDYPNRSLEQLLADVVEFHGLEAEAVGIVKDSVAMGIREERRILAKIRKSDAFDYFNCDESTATAFIRTELARHSGKCPLGRMPVERVHASTGPVSPEVEQMRKRFEECGCDGVFPIKGQIHEVSLRLMEDVLDSGINTILALRPGSLKSTAALITIAARANPDNRWWLVCGTVKDVRRKAEILRSMGCNARAWHAYHPDFCGNPGVPKGRRALRSVTKDFCTECDDRMECPAYHRSTAANRWDPEDTDILVTTHKHWVQALVSGMIPDSVRHVVVDEAPALNESLELSKTDFGVLEKLFAKGVGQAPFASLASEIDARLANGDCAKIEGHIPDPTFRRILGFLHGKYSPLEDMPEKQADLVFSFLSFFRGECLRFGMKQYDRGPDRTGDRGPLVTRFIKGEVNLDCEQHTVVLDGSAFMSETAWKGFRIVQCPDLLRTYPNMTVDIIQRHPSARKLADDDSFGEYRERALGFVDSHPKDEELIVLVNKHLESKPAIRSNVTQILDEIRQRHPAVVEMGYGDHIGSNDGVKATGFVFCVALFAPYSHYVLRAALAEQKAIPGKHIWRKDDIFGLPKLSKYRFKNDAIQAAYVRSVTRDLMQGIFRGKIRDDANSPYRVLLVVQGLSIVRWLEKEFPGATIEYPDKGLCFAAEDGASRAVLVDEVRTAETGNRQGYKEVDRVIDELGFVPSHHGRDTCF